MTSNRELRRIFNELATARALEGASSFRVAAHYRTARLLRGLDRELSDLQSTELDSLLERTEGLGAGAQRRLREILDTGVLREHRELLERVPRGLFEILDIPGLGPKAVRQLWQELAVVDLAGLRAALDSGDVERLSGMGKKTVLNLREALDWRARHGGRIPLGIALPIAEELIGQLRSLPGVHRAAIAGSLRRGADSVKDLDLVVACNEPATVAQVFTERAGGIVAQGDTKVSMRLEAEGRSIAADLRLIEEASWGAALLYFTGSKEHNVELRQRARQRGMSLNEYGLWDSTEPRPHENGANRVAAATEEEIYRALELDVRPPELREEWGRAAPANELIDVASVHTELHAHTTASDGRHSLDDLIGIAKQRGYRVLAITDHSQSSAVAGGLEPQALVEHAAAVRAAASRVRDITVLAGSEVDILADGTLDYEDDLLASLDLVVASPHAALQQEPAEATRRLVKAASHPHVDVLGHPTGRKVGRREGLRADLAKVFRAAAENGTAVEINANWNRLDLKAEHVSSALEAGCSVAINTDAHHESDFDNLRYGIVTGRRGGLTREGCINCWPVERLLDWLEKPSAER